MKAKSPLYVMCLFTALFCGCAGYNHVLFATKSNVGLDFDTQPPAAELTVSRKEAVIAPSFEGGQTPPVIASFKPRTEVGGGFKNFFVGVDQTFAGGDASVSMARNYSRPDVVADLPETYDSSLTIANDSPARSYKAWWRKIPSNGETRPFIFSTDTLLGVKVAWSGAAGQFPDSVKAGFNRKEFAWAPLSISNDTRVRIPSFLATIESRMEVGSSNASISGLQYFATGKTATLLTLQPAVRRAMIERLDPEADSLKLNAAIGSTLLSTLEQILTAYAQEGDAVAREHKAALQQLEGISLPPNFQSSTPPLIRYAYHRGPKTLVRETNYPAANYGNSLQDAVSILETLRASFSSIEAALTDLDANQNVTVNADRLGGNAVQLDRAELESQRTEQRKFAEALATKLSTHPEIVSAYMHIKSRF